MNASKHKLPKSAREHLAAAIRYMRRTGKQLFAYKGKGKTAPGFTPRQLQHLGMALFNLAENPQERTITHKNERFTDLTTHFEFNGVQIAAGAFINGETLWWLKIDRAPKHGELIALA